MFRLVMTVADGGERVFYGKFHTFLRKEAGRWRIVADYDFDEGGTVTEETFARRRTAGLISDRGGMGNFADAREGRSESACGQRTLREVLIRLEAGPSAGDQDRGLARSSFVVTGE